VGRNIRAAALGLLLLLVWLVPGTASAAPIDLYDHMCSATLPDRASRAEIATAAYQCGAEAPTRGTDWLWLRLDASRLRSLPANWDLLVDQTRFDRIAVLVVTRDGTARQAYSATDLRGRWAPGGLLKFAIAPPGGEIRGLYLGFRHIDDLSLMRKVVARPGAGVAVEDVHWWLLVGLFAGTLLSALLYNLVIHTGRRLPFQRWYLLWVSISLVYGLIWTNVAALVVPDLVGPIAVRMDFVLVGLMVGVCNMFFFAVIEDGILPAACRTIGHWLAGASALLGIMASADTVLPPVLMDQLLSYVLAGTSLIIAVSCLIAARRGSRVVWFYIIGWTPVIAIFVARLARNLGLAEQSDAVDMGGFAALAFEALVLSLAIADRFRRIQRELESARQRREIDQIETRTLRAAAHTDFLTGLGNRAAYQHHAQALIDTQSPFSLFLVDVDFLKDVNDRLGHGSGDALLRHIGSALATASQPLDDVRIARIGGDEFAILCPGPLAVDAALAEAIGTVQGQKWLPEDPERIVSLSIGSARYPDDAEALDLLYHNADLALYSAKRRGRGRHIRYDLAQSRLRDLQVAFAEEAEGALERGEFLLYLQPIVALETETVVGHEALLRWNHPQHGLMSVDRFADVLVTERIGLRIQDHVLEMALALLRDQGEPLSGLSVNFTSAQLTGPRAARNVLDRLAHHGIAPDRLCVEVTEGVMLDRASDSILANLRTLHAAGVGIALDDFGTGYASLIHLRRLPVDRIKIDRSFVAGLDQSDGSTLPIVSAIVGMGTGLGKLVVAEGIQTEIEAQLLRQLGCQLGQGYLYGRPSPYESTVRDASAPIAAR